jgi:hypothetical protein
MHRGISGPQKIDQKIPAREKDATEGLMALNRDTYMKWINGSTGSSAELREKLASLEADRAGWKDKLARVEGRKQQAEFDLADEKTIARIEIDRVVALGRIAGFEGRISETRKELEDARVAERAKSESQFIERHRAHYQRYRAALLTIADVHNALTALRAQARAQLGDARSDVVLPVFAYAGVLMAPFIADWCDRNDAAVLASPPPEVQQARGCAVAVAPAPNNANLQAPVALNRSGKPEILQRLTAERTPDDLAPLRVGEARVRVHRNGYHVDDNSVQCHSGQIVRMPEIRARHAAGVGLVTILETADQTAARPEARP